MNKLYVSNSIGKTNFAFGLLLVLGLVLSQLVSLAHEKPSGNIELPGGWVQIGNYIIPKASHRLDFRIPGTSTSIPKDSLSSNYFEDPTGVDCIRFSMTSNRDSVGADQEIELTIVAEYIDNIPYSWMNKDCGDFSLKVFFPEGFVQTGGEYTDFEGFSFRPGGIVRIERKIKGRFTRQPEETCFTITKGAKFYDPSYLLVKKEEFCVTSINILKKTKSNRLLESSNLLLSESKLVYQDCLISGSCARGFDQNASSRQGVNANLRVSNIWVTKDLTNNSAKIFFKMTNLTNNTLDRFAVLVEEGNCIFEPTNNETVFCLGDNIVLEPNSTKIIQYNTTINIIDNYVNFVDVSNGRRNHFDFSYSRIDANGNRFSEKNCGTGGIPIELNITAKQNECDIQLEASPGSGTYVFYADGVEIIQSSQNSISIDRKLYYNTQEFSVFTRFDDNFSCGVTSKISFIGSNVNYVEPSIIFSHANTNCLAVLEVINCSSNIIWEDPSGVKSYQNTLPINSLGEYKVSCIGACGFPFEKTYTENSITSPLNATLNLVNCNGISGTYTNLDQGLLKLYIDNIYIPNVDHAVGNSSGSFLFNVPSGYNKGKHTVKVIYTDLVGKTGCPISGSGQEFCCELDVPEITDLQVCIGETTNLSVNPVDGADTYKWVFAGGVEKTGKDISHTFTAGNLGTARLEAYTNPAISGCNVSKTFNVTQKPSIAVDLLSNNVSRSTFNPTIGSNVVLSTNLSSSAGYTYKWYKGDDQNNVVSTASSFTIYNISLSELGKYTVIVSKDGFCSGQDNVTIGCEAPVSGVKILLSNISKGEFDLDVDTYNPDSGNQLELIVSSVGGSEGVNLTYNWTKNGANIGSSNKVDINSYNPSTDKGVYKITGSYSATGCSATFTDILTLGNCPTVTNIVINGGQTSPYTASPGESVQLQAVVSPSGSAGTYTWKKNGTIISGANAGTYTVSNFSASSVGDYLVTYTPTGCGATEASSTLNLSCNGLNAQMDVFVNDIYQESIQAGQQKTVRVKVGENFSVNMTDIAGASYIIAQPPYHGANLSQRTKAYTNVNYGFEGIYTGTASKNGCNSQFKLDLDVVCFDPIANIGGEVNGNYVPTKIYANTGDNVKLVASWVEGASYEWFGPSYYVQEFSPTISNITKSQAGYYTVKATKSGCQQQATVEVVVNCNTLAGFKAENSSPNFQQQTGDKLNIWCLPNPSGATYSWTGPAGYSNNWTGNSFDPATINRNGTYTVTVSHLGCTASATTIVKLFECNLDFNVAYTACNLTTNKGGITISPVGGNASRTKSYRIEKITYNQNNEKVYGLAPEYPTWSASASFANLPAGEYRVWTREYEGSANRYCIADPKEIAIRCDPCSHVEITKKKNNLSYTGNTLDVDNNGNVVPISMQVIKNSSSVETIQVNTITGLTWNAPNGYTSTANPYSVKLPGVYEATFTVNSNQGSKVCSTKVDLELPLCNSANTELDGYRTYCSNAISYVTLYAKGDIGNIEYSTNLINWTVGETISLPGADESYTVYVRSSDYKNCLSEILEIKSPICTDCYVSGNAEVLQLDLPMISCSLEGTWIALRAYYYKSTPPTVSTTYNLTEYRLLDGVSRAEIRGWQPWNYSTNWSKFENLPPGKYIGVARKIGTDCEIEITFEVPPTEPVEPADYECELTTRKSLGENLLEMEAKTQKTWSGYALQLDGFKDYVSSGQLLNSKNNFTFEIWAKPDQNEVIRIYDNATLNESQITYGYYNQRQLARGYFYNYPSPSTDKLSGVSVIMGANGVNLIEVDPRPDLLGRVNYQHVVLSYKYDFKEWAHVAFTCDGQDYHLFINGNEVASKPVRNKFISSSNSGGVLPPYLLGGSGYGYFKGMVDEARWWKKQLTSAELKANMNKMMLSPYNVDLVRYHRFDEVNGTTVKNEVGGNASLPYGDCNTYKSQTKGTDGLNIQPSFSWTGPNGFTASGAKITTPTPLVSSTYTVTITYPNGQTCSREVPVEIPPCTDLDVTMTPANGTVLANSGVRPVLFANINNPNAKPIVDHDLGKSLDLSGGNKSADGQDYSWMAYNFTVEAWVKPLLTTEMGTSGWYNGGGRLLFEPSWTSDNNRAGFGLAVGTNGFVLFEHGPSHFSQRVVQPYNLNGWNHIAVVYENNVARVYINGEIVYNMQGNNAKAIIGPSRLGGWDTKSFKGLVDEFRVWGVARSDQEIRENFTGSIVASDPNKGYWKFDDPAKSINGGTKEVDESTFARELNLQNGASRTAAAQTSQIVINPKITWYKEVYDESSKTNKLEEVGVGSTYRVPYDELEPGNYNYRARFVTRTGEICEDIKSFTVSPHTQETDCFTMTNNHLGVAIPSNAEGERLLQQPIANGPKIDTWKRIKQADGSYYVFSTFNNLSWKYNGDWAYVTMEEGDPSNNDFKWNFIPYGNNFKIETKSNLTKYLHVNPGESLPRSIRTRWDNDNSNILFGINIVDCPSDETPPTCIAEGRISYDRWENVTSFDINNPTTLLATSSTVSDYLTETEKPGINKDNYVSRIRGYICPPETGYYTFWTAGDDKVHLYLSTDDQPENKRRIAYNNSSSGLREYEKYGAYGTQRSFNVGLKKGTTYYIEIVHQEYGGGDGLSVKWRTPSNQEMAPIPSQFLAPYNPNLCKIFAEAEPEEDELLVGTQIDMRAFIGEGGTTADVIFDWTGEFLVDIDNTTNPVTTWDGKDAIAIPTTAGEYVWKVQKRGDVACYTTIKKRIVDVLCGCTDCGDDGLAIKSDQISVTRVFSAPGQNYVVENVHLDGNLNGAVAQTISYFDGLGRPLQTIQKGTGPNGEDIVSAMVYDAFGRMPKEFLPFANNGGNGQLISDFTNTASTYFNSSPAFNDANKGQFFMQKTFESSPMSRPLSSKLPGEQSSADVTYRYLSGGNIPILAMNPADTVVINNGNYAVNSLYINETVDQKGVVTREYTTKEGTMILKEVAGHKTRYVYDDFGLLRAVIPPKGEALAGAGFTMFDASSATAWELAFMYDYDGRGNMIKKKIPGTNAVSTMTYDVRDRLITEITAKGDKFTFVYDNLNRLTEKRIGSTAATLIQRNIYDSYTDAVTKGFDGFHSPDVSTSLAKGRLVTTINYVLESGMPSNSNSALKTTTYTDNVGKVVQVASINHTNGKDFVYNNVDFVGKVLRTKAIVQNRYIGQNVTIEQNFSYDKGQRTKSICQRVDNGSPQAYWEPVARYKYDGTGKMYQKTLGCKLQIVDYTYNLNGWMKSMNNPTNLVSGKDFFGMKLNYDTDGNIKSQQFGYADRKGKHTDLGFSVKAGPVYNNVYSYDNLKRITSHTIGTNGNSSDILNLTNSYDENGNILTMNRTIQGIAVDAMSYTYQAGGNRISSIAESGGEDRDAKYETFKPRGSGNYTYDAAGNIKNDSYKGTGDITYNVLNLPSTMASRSFKQFYNASGAKVRSERAEGKYDYIGPLVYKNNQLEFVSTAEGRALPPGIVKQNFNYDGSGGRDTTNRFWRYEYNLKDHLGNLRVTCRCAEKNEIDQDNRTDAYKPLVVQQAHYDAWGMKLPLFNPDKKYEGSPKDNFKYNGKEYMADLGYYEYGFRIYDPTTARFTAVDPLAEKNHTHSPYSYAGNNPILNIDPDGRDFGIYYDHEKKTITVRAEYVTRSKDQQSAERATGFWNKQSGQYKYVVGSGKDAVAYTVNFDIKVSIDDAPANPRFDGATDKYPSHGAERAQNDDTNELNAYDVLPDRSGYFESGDPSKVKAGGATADHVAVSESSRNSNTGAHEVGHTLGTSHDYGGLMSPVNSGGGISANNVGEVLGRAGLGTTRLGADSHGTGRVNGVIGTAPTGFTSGTTMSNRKYEKMLQKQRN